MGFREFFSNLWDLGSNTAKTGAKLSEVAVKLLNQLVKGVDWLIELPEKAEQFAYKSWAVAKNGIPYLIDSLKRPGSPTMLPEYKTEIPRLFKRPTPKEFGFKVQKGKENPAYRAALYQVQLCYLSYRMKYNSNLTDPMMKEYQKINKRIIEIKRENIKRRNARRRLKAQYAVVIGRIKSCKALGTENVTLQKHYNRKREILIDLQKVSKDVSPIVKWAKFVSKKIEYPKGSVEKVDYFYTHKTQTQTKDIYELQKHLAAYLTPFTKQNVMYAKEISKLAYWRDAHLKTNQDKGQKAAYDKYNTYAKDNLKKLKIPITPPL